MRTPLPRPGLGRFAPLLMLLLAFVPAACAGSDADDPAVSADTRTRSQQDSIIGTWPIPGAGALGRAREASEAAAERARTMDVDGSPQR